MTTRISFIVGGIFGRFCFLGITSLYVSIFAFPLSAQEVPTNIEIQSVVTHVGTAVVSSVTPTSNFYPAVQPDVYWHDAEWNIDLVHRISSNDPLSISVQHSSDSKKIVELPRIFAQVDSITRNPEDKAIILAEATGTAEAFLIIDLKERKLIDRIGMDSPSISPDRRLILYTNGYPAHGPGQAAQYHLYDTLKTPRENTCGYRLNDPQHKDLDESYRGIQVYPRKGNSVSCSDAELKAFEDDDHDMVSGFVWSADSSKAVFADIMNGSTISLILVKIPHGERDKDRDKDHDGDRDRDHDRDNDWPRTFIYSFTGAENVCAGAATCDSNNVRSIAWNGDAVKVTLIQANPTGPAIVKNLTIPLSKFVPLAK